MAAEALESRVLGERGGARGGDGGEGEGERAGEACCAAQRELAGKEDRRRAEC